MKVRDFINLESEIDVYDDVCEELGICFCGPLALTDEGRSHFREVLDYDMTLDFTGTIPTAVVCVDSDDDRTWRSGLRKAKEFFEAAAGYCACDDYDRWFFSETR